VRVDELRVDVERVELRVDELRALVELRDVEPAQRPRLLAIG